MKIARVSEESQNLRKLHAKTIECIKNTGFGHLPVTNDDSSESSAALHMLRNTVSRTATRVRVAPSLDTHASMAIGFLCKGAKPPKTGNGTETS